MAIRNRLAALSIRAVLFAAYVFFFVAYVENYTSIWLALCNFNVEMMFVIITMTGLEFIFNLIDLIRHGVWGAAAGPYMPFAIPITGFAILSALTYFLFQAPASIAPVNPLAVVCNILLIVGPLLDFLVNDEKGTATISAVLMWQLYPILFHVFGYFRTVIFPNAAIYNGAMYALPFLNYFDPNIVWWSLLFFLSTTGIGALLVFLSNLLAGKFRSYDIKND